MAHAAGSCVWGAASVASGLMWYISPLLGVLGSAARPASGRPRSNFFQARRSVRAVVPSLGARRDLCS